MEDPASKSKKDSSGDQDASLQGISNGLDLDQGCRMAFSPKESPIYGGNTIVVAFGENTTLLPDCELFLIFDGAKKRHITQAKIVNQQTLQATIPGHDTVESVQLLVCMFRNQSSQVLATNQFEYIYGSAHYMAEFLVDSVNDISALENLDHIKSDSFSLAEESLSTLDDRLSSAFTHIGIPENWNILGDDGAKQETSPRETLLHFAARLGLEKVASYLLDKPGSEKAVFLPNHHGEIPQDIARDLGQDMLANLLSESGHHSMVKHPPMMEPPDSYTVTREENGLTTMTLPNTSDMKDIGADIDRIRQIIHPSIRSISADPPSLRPDADILRSRSSSDETPSDEVEHISDDTDDEDDDETFHKDPIRPTYRIYQSRPTHLRRQATDPEYHMRTRPIPSISLTSPQSGTTVVLEESIRQLHSISEGIQRLRHFPLFPGTAQDARKGRLQRFSSSCPSLAEQQELKPSPGLIDCPHESGYHSSMLNIAQEQAGNYRTKDAAMHDYNSQGLYNIDASGNTLTSNVKICINDVTVDSTEDAYSSQQCVTEFDELDKVKKTRRRSWCPQSQGVHDMGHRKASMLAVMGRSMSLSSLDSNDESSSTSEEEDEDQYHDAQDVQAPGGQSPDIASPVSIGPPKANSTPSESDRQPSTPRPSSAMNSSVGVRSLTDVRFDLNSDENSETTSPSPVFRPTSHRSLSPDVNQTSSNLVLPGSNLTKSISTPSIPSAKEEGKGKADERRGSNISEVLPQGKIPPQNASIQKMVEEHDIKRRQSERLDRSEEEILNGLLRTNRRRRGRHMSMVEFYHTPHHDSGNYDEDDDHSQKEGKGEKKRKSSVFSKLGSYRKDRKDKSREKEQKRSTHQYVSVSFSNSTSCDVCGKSMANKPALQCENCLVNVHENTCKDQIAACSKFKQFRALQRQGGPGHGSTRVRNVSASLPAGTGLKSSQSFKEKRVAPLQIKQNVSNTTASQRNTSPPSKVINEENEDNQKDLEGVGSNIMTAMSASIESLDDAVEEDLDYEDDTELMLLQEPDPEAWSITVDKKTLKKMAPKDIKRQDHIWELLLTEKHHCRTLKIMKTIFYRGMSQECQLNHDLIDKIFPKLDDLIDIHINFLHRLQDRQGEKKDMSFDTIGDILSEQFNGDNGERLKEAYGEFCSRHKEAVNLYKDILKTDRKFQGFIKKCSNNRLCKRLSIPECILLVTHRMTKYPLLLDPIIKTTKDKTDKEHLNQALSLAKDILNDINQQVGRYEKEQRLIEIYHKLDARSTAWFKGRKFKKSDLLSTSRKLIHEGVISWKNARGKLTDSIAVVLSDLMFFLQENNQKYTFFSQDNKSAVISLSKLLVREKGDTRDSRGIYLISQNKLEPEMYELVCNSSDKRKEWIEIVQAASKLCPEEEEEVPSESEEERRQQEEKAAKVLSLVKRLEQRDRDIKNYCDDKIKIISKIMEINGHEGLHGELQSPYLDEEKKEFKDPEELFQAASKEASKLQVMLQGAFAVVSLNRSVSSVGEQESIGYTPTPLPKRAETFTAFDTTRSAIAAKKRGVYAIRDSGGRSTSLQNLNRQESDNDLLLTVDMSKQWAMRRGSAGVPDNSNKAAQKDARNRRMSTSFLQNLLKQNPNDESRGSDGGNEKSSHDASYSSYMNQPLGGTSCRELVHSLTQIMQYMHGIVVVASRQRTQVESLKSQLHDNNLQLNKLSTDAQKQMQEKKNLYRHNQQLEELRSLQQTIRKEREAWEKEKDKERVRVEQEHLELDEKKKELEKQKAEIKKESEELQRQKEALQRQVDFLKYQFPPAHQSPLLTSGRHDSESSVVSAPSKVQTPTASSSTPSSPSINHRRSASADFRQQEDATDSYDPPKPEYTQSLKEPLNKKSPTSESFKIRPLSDGTLQGALPRKELPIHLLSATNEQKTSTVRQQLPLKLAAGKSPLSSSVSSLSSAQGPKGSGLHYSSSHLGTSVQQQIPSKLVSSSSAGKISHNAPPAMLPMKLAEDKGKSSRITSPTVTSPKSKSPKENVQKNKETEVIYF